MQISIPLMPRINKRPLSCGIFCVFSVFSYVFLTIEPGRLLCCTLCLKMVSKSPIPASQVLPPSLMLYSHSLYCNFIWLLTLTENVSWSASFLKKKKNYLNYSPWYTPPVLFSPSPLSLCILLSYYFLFYCLGKNKVLKQLLTAG